MIATIAYRDSLEGLRIRYAELLAERTQDPSLAGASRVFGARTGRIWAGNTGIAGAVLLALGALATLAVPGLPLTTLLLLSWPAMLGAGAVGWVLADRRVRREGAPRPTGDVRTDLARLQAALPASALRDLAVDRERRSLARPMIAVALLAPLTIHAVVYLGFGGGLAAFNNWIGLSLLCVGHAHLALAWGCHRFARNAASLTGYALEQAGRRAQWRAFGFAVLFAALPGGVLYLIPPILTAATGLLFNPILFLKMTGTLVAERAALG